VSWPCRLGVALDAPRGVPRRPVRLVPVTRKVRGLWLAVAIVAIVAGLVWLWRSPHRNDLATFGSLVLAIVALPSPLIVYLAKVRSRGEASQGRALDAAADLLAGAVEDQWTREATDRGLLQPEPIPVRWETPSKPYAGPGWVAEDSRLFPRLPQLAAVGQGQLREGQISDLHTVYGGPGSGRLVIVGAPGSGKTGAAVLLVRDALKYRRQLKKKDRRLVPVPVMFTLDGWDPNKQRVKDWLAERLKQTYPQFTAKRDAAKLVKAGKLAVILDGLDEIPGQLQPLVLRALSDQADFRIVVLARSSEMLAATQQDFLLGAAALELQDIDGSAAADYLTRVQVYPAPPAWRELTDRLRSVPDSPIAKALSRPLGLTLVRDTYRARDEVRELLDFCDAPGRDVSREDIEDHLLDRVLHAAYSPRPAETPPYDLRTARGALCYIAARMNQDDTRDLEWWRISPWTSAAQRAITTGLVSAFVFALAGALAGGLVLGLKFGFGFGLGYGLAFGLCTAELAGQSPEWIEFPLWRQAFNRWSAVFGLAGGLAGGLAIGLAIGPVEGLAFGLAIGLAGWLAGWLWQLEGDVSLPEKTSSLSPLASWRRDRTSKLALGLAMGLASGLGFGLAGRLAFGLGGRAESLMSELPSWLGSASRFELAGRLVSGLGSGLVFGLVFGLGVARGSEAIDAGGLTSGVVGSSAAGGLAFGLAGGFLGGRAGGLVFGLAGGLAGGLMFGIMYSPTWRTSLAFLQLAAREHTPVRLMRFLKDAREREVLRTVGPVYQFRHARLQDRLAGQASSARPHLPRRRAGSAL
jgi:hypothetical protein